MSTDSCTSGRASQHRSGAPLSWIRGVVLCVSAVPLLLGAQTAAPAGAEVTPADVQFMQTMIGHHQQAVEMTVLIAARSRRRDLRSLGERIAVSQADEIALMRRWLERHAGVASTGVAHDMSHRSMPGDSVAHSMAGMLTRKQMRSLRGSRGTTFDSLFLTGMIQHHAGAVTMVANLLTTPGAAQESSINRFVSDVNADQRAEIARMRLLLRQR